jgi:hypothetical protein
MARNLLPVRVDDLHLTAKEQKFILEYVSNAFDGIDAAKKSGLLPESVSKQRAHLFVHSLLARDEINQAVNRISESMVAPYKSRFVDQTLRRLYIRANYDPLWYFFPDGTARPMDQISQERRWAIDKVEPKIYGKNADVREVTYVLADQDKARVALQELINKRDEGSGKGDEGMRSKLDEIFQAVRLGAQLSEGKKKKEAEPDMIEAPDQKTILRTPTELLKGIRNGEVEEIKAR